MKKIWYFFIVLILSMPTVSYAIIANSLNFPVDESSYVPGSYAGRSFFYDSDHLGEDIDLPEGTPIKSIGNGKIVWYSSAGGYGELVAVIEHDLGEEYIFPNAYNQNIKTKKILSIYGHIRKGVNRDDPADELLQWKVGDTILEGEIVGYINDSSHPDGGTPDHNGDGLEHLHLGIRLSDKATAEVRDPGFWFRGYEKATDFGKDFSSAQKAIKIFHQDRLLARIEGQSAIYWLQNGIAYQVLNSSILQEMSIIPGWNEIFSYPESLLEIRPPGSLFPEGTFKQGPDFISTSSDSNGLTIKLPDDPNVWLVYNGERWWLSVFNWDDVITVTETIMNSIPGDVITPAISMWSPFFFRSNVGPNALGWGWGGCNPEMDLVCDTIGIGCYASPVNSTSVVAENINTGYLLNLYNFGHIAEPYEFGRRIAYDPAKTGPWIITATNGPDSAALITHTIDDAGQMPFLRNVKLTGTGLTPTISWSVPSGSGADRVQINVIDRNTGNKLWWSQRIDLETTSFTIPNGVLQANHPYLIRAIIQDTVSGAIYGPDKSRAESFFEFTPLEEGQQPSVFIPTVGPDLDPTDEFAAAYAFDIDVELGVPCFIDPYVAIGYDYAVGVDDTVRFASVTFPEVGDNLFDLYLWDHTGFYLAMNNLGSGVTYNFGPEGVDKFRILGIEEEAELDPLDVTAFITEITFTETGKFTGSMVPIISIDNDNDGILDYQDNCDNSILNGTVVIDGCDSGVENVLLEGGCTISDLISQCAEDADNHGKFVSSVSHTTNFLKKNGIINGKGKGKIQKCAAKAEMP